MISPLTLDVIVPTFRRPALLHACLQSFVDAEPVERMPWRATVVDNGSGDETPAVIQAFIDRYPDRFRYLHEAKPGKSAAQNAAIRASDRDLIGLIDDDEQITKPWLGIVERAFQSGTLQYLGGPYFGSWATSRPDWSPPPGYEGVLSVDDPASLPDGPVPFGTDNRLFLRGGNAVFRRSLFDTVGLFSEDLGRLRVGLGSCEDEDMFRRLRAAGMRGVYDPALAVLHHVPPERVTRSYYRRWAWDQAASLARLERRSPSDVPHVGRVPRWRIGAAVYGLRGLLSSSPAERFAAELRWRTLLGYVAGAYVRP